MRHLEFGSFVAARAFRALVNRLMGYPSPNVRVDGGPTTDVTLHYSPIDVDEARARWSVPVTRVAARLAMPIVRARLAEQDLAELDDKVPRAVDRPVGWGNPEFAVADP
jgi:hypothetical protein